MPDLRKAMDVLTILDLQTCVVGSISRMDSSLDLRNDCGMGLLAITRLSRLEQRMDLHC